ncbi:MAG: hypothetical protein OHK0052_13180 [Anaerolineales bacterium]
MNTQISLPRTFRASVVLWLSAVFFTLLTLFFFFTVLFQSNAFQIWFIALGITGFTLFLWASIATVIQAEPTAIIWRMLWFERVIPWSDLGEVHDNDYQIKLISRDGFTKIKFNLQLSGYIDLLEILYAQRPDLFTLPADDVYRPQYWRDYERVQWGIVAVIFLFSGITGLLYDAGFAVLMLTLGMLSLLYLGYTWLLNTPRHVQIMSGGLQLTYVNRVEIFTIGQISQILYRKPSRMRRNNPVYRAEIWLLNGRVVPLGFAQQGTIKTYFTLRRWFGTIGAK